MTVKTGRRVPGIEGMTLVSVSQQHECTYGAHGDASPLTLPPGSILQCDECGQLWVRHGESFAEVDERWVAMWLALTVDLESVTECGGCEDDENAPHTCGRESEGSES